VGVRGPLAPKPAVAERRASDVLPRDPSTGGAATWIVTLAASIVRAGWQVALFTGVFLGGTFGATWARGRSVGAATPWALIGAGVWLVLAVAWTLVRARR
jgi:hypothetical protein